MFKFHIAIGTALFSILAVPGLLHAQTEAEKAATASAKAKAEELDYLVKAQKSQYELDSLEATRKADAEKALRANQIADDKAALEVQKLQQDLIDKQLANANTATKGIADTAARSDIKDVAVTGESIETVALAYQALGTAAKQMADELAAAPPCSMACTLILVDEQALNGLIIYQATLEELARLQTNYAFTISQSNAALRQLREAFDKPAEAPEIAVRQRSVAALAIAMQGIYAATTLFQTFKSQMAVAGKFITVDQAALLSLLAKNWQADVKSTPKLVIYPNLTQPLRASPVVAALKALNGAYDSGRTAETALAQEISRKQALLGIPKAGAMENAVVIAQRQLITETNDALAVLKEINADMGKIIANFSPISNSSLLPSLIKSGYLFDNLKNGQLALHIKVISVGGNTMTTNNFWRGAKIFRSGGVVIAYYLINANGEFAAGNLLSSQTGYIQLDGNSLKNLGNSWQSQNISAKKSGTEASAGIPPDGATPQTPSR